MLIIYLSNKYMISLPGYLTKAVVRVDGLGGGGGKEGSKGIFNLGCQSREMLPFSKKLKTNFSEKKKRNFQHSEGYMK